VRARGPRHVAFTLRSRSPGSIPGMDVTLVVRVSRDGAGTLRGVVERVKTGEKERFVGTDTLRDLIERMAGVGVDERRGGSRRRRAKRGLE